ncbi:hypothetical protein DPMN_020861 [Dreissena polymorpha]|uniref:Uncharacterized protein n=1 Tax=Dreissena polymorpha TaxID=45954 RepID=A0A9D4SAL4_DREPO|nr:hypothetical protein DPMN_020861 [Dreissena polymorpha]
MELMFARQAIHEHPTLRCSSPSLDIQTVAEEEGALLPRDFPRLATTEDEVLTPEELESATTYSPETISNKLRAVMLKRTKEQTS